MKISRNLSATLAAVLFSAVAAYAVALSQPFVNDAVVSTANPMPVTGTLTTSPSGTQDVNLTQTNGAALSKGHGLANGTLRVELPTDGTGVVGLNAGTAIIGKAGIDQTTPGTTNAVSATNFPATVSVNTGATGASSPRVTVAVDSATVAGSATLPAGANIVGKVGIDQTTPGTTNLVSAAQSGTWTVQPGNTANTTAWKVDGSAVTQPVGGGVADAATDSGNPNKVGGVYESAPPTYTAGQRSTLHTGTKGSLRMELYAPDSTQSVNVGTTAAGGVTSPTSTLATRDFPFIYNGATWDQTFTCPSSVAIAVTAGNTTQLVALVSAKTIRVCSFVITESLAGTLAFVYGTGSNCATGQAALTGTMNMTTGGDIALSAPSGGSLFSTASANALCLTATTGNINGFVTYAQF